MNIKEELFQQIEETRDLLESTKDNDYKSFYAAQLIALSKLASRCELTKELCQRMGAVSCIQ